LRIDDHNLVVFDDVFDVLFIQRVGTQELADLVDALALMGEAILRLVFLLNALLLGERGITVDLRIDGGDVW
jgi:hypothetical protein